MLYNCQSDAMSETVRSLRSLQDYLARDFPGCLLSLWEVTKHAWHEQTNCRQRDVRHGSIEVESRKCKAKPKGAKANSTKREEARGNSGKGLLMPTAP
jgi:hypothetical protein